MAGTILPLVHAAEQIEPHVGGYKIHGLCHLLKTPHLLLQVADCFPLISGRPF